MSEDKAVVRKIVIIVALIVAVSVAVPLILRGRELSKRLVCASNMKAIGTSAKVYGNAYAEQGLPILEQLVGLSAISS